MNKLKTVSTTTSATAPKTDDNILPKYVQRFLNKLIENKETGCLEYQGALCPNGYGVYWDGKNSVLSHRFAYDSFKADLPESGVIAHSCNNKRCCNWDHLRPATHKENSADARRDGLLDVPRRPRRKITDSEVADIRARAKSGESKYSIAKLYDRHEGYIALIVSAKLHSPELKVARAERAAKRQAERAARVPGKRGPKPVSEGAALQEAA